MSYFTEKVHEIREYVWPLLDKETNKKRIEKYNDDFTLDNKDDISIAYSLALKYYEAEEERKNTVERKAVVFIGVVGLAITILVSSKGIAIEKSGSVSCLSAAILCLIIIYLCRMAWFAVAALKVDVNYTLGYKDILNQNENYQKNIILQLIKCAQNNFSATNLRVDNLNMAQAYFKRSIATICLYALFLLFSSINLELPNNIFQNMEMVNMDVIQIADVVYKAATLVLAITVAYFGYKYNNNVKNARIVDERRLKAQYYHVFLESCIKYFSYVQNKNAQANMSLEAADYNMNFCIEVSRLPLYASEEIIQYLSKCQDKTEALDLSKLENLIIDDLESNDVENEKGKKNNEQLKVNKVIVPTNLIVTIEGKKTVINNKN